MTVTTTTSSNGYTANGVLTSFAYTFKIFADADLEVILLETNTGTETAQTLTTHYTVTNAGNANGGNVVFVTAPASGYQVKIRRVLDATQETDYVENDTVPAEAHEEGLPLGGVDRCASAASKASTAGQEGRTGSRGHRAAPPALKHRRRGLSCQG